MEDFDWVAARSECSPTKVFEKLKNQVQSDIEKRGATLLQAQRERYKFEFVPDRNSFSVMVSGDTIHGVVKFGLTETGVVVLDAQGKPIFAADVTVSDNGECRLTVDGKEKELWQVRKMALEKYYLLVTDGNVQILNSRIREKSGKCVNVNGHHLKSRR